MHSRDSIAIFGGQSAFLNVGSSVQTSPNKIMILKYEDHWKTPSKSKPFEQLLGS